MQVKDAHLLLMYLKTLMIRKLHLVADGLKDLLYDSPLLREKNLPVLMEGFSGPSVHSPLVVAWNLWVLLALNWSF